MAMFDSIGNWRVTATSEGPPDVIGPAVLEQALGSSLEPGERVACARFVLFTTGQFSGGSEKGAHAIIVTDRRVMKVQAWLWDSGTANLDPAVELWERDVPLPKGFLIRRSVWFGQIGDLERSWFWGKDRRLVLHTVDRRKQTVTARAETILTLEAAIRDALEGPGRSSLPPRTTALPDPIGGWPKRLADILRPNRRMRG